MVARVRTVAFSGVEVIDVDTQVTIASGLPAFNVVGLPDKAVAESRERVRAALAALGLALPPRRITVNLAPADVLKEGSHFDLPIALGLLAEMGVLPQDELAGYTALGEVALDGSLTSVPGVLLAALAAAARDSGIISSPAPAQLAPTCPGLPLKMLNFTPAPVPYRGKISLECTGLPQATTVGMPPKMHLSDASLRALPFMESGQKDYPDPIIPGFTVRVGTRSKTFRLVAGSGRSAKSTRSADTTRRASRWRWLGRKPATSSPPGDSIRNHPNPAL